MPFKVNISISCLSISDLVAVIMITLTGDQYNQSITNTCSFGRALLLNNYCLSDGMINTATNWAYLANFSIYSNVKGCLLASSIEDTGTDQ